MMSPKRIAEINPQTSTCAFDSKKPFSASTAERYPISPHAYICQGVHIPCPKKKLDTSAASAPTAKPPRLPRTAPAMIQIAVTGLTSGKGANNTRPAAAIAAQTTTGRICLSAGLEASIDPNIRATTSKTESSVSAAVARISLARNSTSVTGATSNKGISMWSKRRESSLEHSCTFICPSAPTEHQTARISSNTALDVLPSCTFDPALGLKESKHR